MKTLKQIRTELGMSQRQLAKITGMLQPNIVVMEKTNLKDAKVPTLSRLASAMQCRAIIQDDAVFFEKIV